MVEGMFGNLRSATARRATLARAFLFGRLTTTRPAGVDQIVSPSNELPGAGHRIATAVECTMRTGAPLATGARCCCVSSRKCDRTYGGVTVGGRATQYCKASQKITRPAVHFLSHAPGPAALRRASRRRAKA